MLIMPYGPVMDAFPKGHRAHPIPRNQIFRIPPSTAAVGRLSALFDLAAKPSPTMTIAGTPSLAVEAHPSKERCP